MVQQIRTQGYFVRDSQERRQWLEEAGFRFETRNQQAVHDEQWENKVLPAIKTYKQVHGDVQGPSHFVVPSSGEWEEGLWNMRLGVAVDHMRPYSTFGRDRPDREKQLNDLGFVWDDLERQWMGGSEGGASDVHANTWRYDSASKFCGAQRRGVAGADVGGEPWNHGKQHMVIELLRRRTIRSGGSGWISLGINGGNHGESPRSISALWAG
jgi:hypothetical protein